MLWKKESKEKDAPFVDIFAPTIDYWESKLDGFLAKMDQTPHPKKSDAIALQKRNEGNEKFREREWLDAIELYGDSLRFAPSKSEHISLAYANRAACFLSLKLYENCLKDIELAKNADYPEHLMPKLQNRNEICLKKMQEDPQPERKLSIESDDQFPCLANIAEVCKNENGEYSVFAKTDVDVGQVVVIEDSFQKYLAGKFGLNCNICLKEYGNLVPCKNCTHAMFCQKCQGDSLHDYECGLNFWVNSDLDNAIMALVRCILQTVKAFSTVDDLMAFVEQCRKNRAEWPANLVDERAKYQLLFGNATNISGPIDEPRQMNIYSVYKTLLRIPQINEMFQSTKHQRFLMHLIGHRIFWQIHGSSWIRLSVAMFKYFKHSCNPNMISTIRDGKSIWISIKPIERGEQLNISRVPLNISTEEKQKQLLENGFKKCACPRCSGKVASPTQRQQMTTDPIYENIQKNIFLMKFNMKKVNLTMLMDDCAAFLRKYGRLEWADEIKKVVFWFLHLFEFRLTADFDHPLARARLQKFLDHHVSL